MRIALLAPLPPEQTGIADYASHLCAALRAQGVTVLTPFADGHSFDDFDWNSIDLAHAELGGGRFREFNALNTLSVKYPELPLTATVHDPERLIWKPENLPGVFRLAERLPQNCQQLATLLCDPLTLHSERKLASKLSRVITLTETGAKQLSQRMRIDRGKCAVVPHGNLVIEPCPLPPLQPLKLLYFGFIYRGKGIEDLLESLALSLAKKPAMASSVKLTLAGGTAPEMTFGDDGKSYLDSLVERIDRLGLSDTVEWALDLPEGEIPTTIQAHHLMILPYRESKKLAWLGEMRGTSGALSWANACGRGVITSNARSFSEEVSSGNGDTFLQGDVESLSDAMTRVFSRPTLIKAWAQNAQSLGNQRQWSSAAKQFKQLFTQACKGESL